MAMNDEVDIQVMDAMAMDSPAFTPTTPDGMDDTELWRNRRRSSRKRAVHARSIDIKKIPKGQLALDRLIYSHIVADRPATRADCMAGARPCLFVSCKHHLYLDVSPRTGSIKLNFPDLEVSEMVETCVLDIADRGGTPIEEVGAIMNLTRERIRQVEVQALATIGELNDEDGLREFDDEGPVRKRRLPVFVESEHNDEEDEDEDLIPASEPEAFEGEMLSSDED